MKIAISSEGPEAFGLGCRLFLEDERLKILADEQAGEIEVSIRNHDPREALTRGSMTMYFTKTQAQEVAEKIMQALQDSKRTSEGTDHDELD